MSKNHCTGAAKLGINHCCAGHDIAYESQIGTRKDADVAFRECIIAHGETNKKGFAYRVVGWVYFLAVRAFGWVFWARCARKLRKSISDR